MDANFAVFAKPKNATYTKSSPHLVWIPRNLKLCTGTVAAFKPPTAPETQRIPCMFFSCNQSTDTIILYFHGTSEDLGNAEYFFYPLKDVWKCHVLVVEYPTYGLYENAPPLGEESIFEDAETVYRFLIERAGLREEQIIVFGRSIGSGPACHLASKFNPLLLMLLSPFKSLREAIGSISFGFLSYLFKERFKNIDLMDKIRSPVLIIHGKKDSLVPLEHSQELIKKCSSTKKQLVEPAQMTHNDFDVIDDLVNPFITFCNRFDLFNETYEHANIDTRIFLNCRIEPPLDRDPAQP
jgi:abhydrolase domain-containing protein 17